MNSLRMLACKAFFPALFFLVINTSVKSQTTLVAGDIAFTGYISTDPSLSDQFSFVLLKNITTNTVIKFTDYGWRPGTSTFGSGTNQESEITFTANANYNAGTEITIVNNPTTVATVAGGGSAGTIVYSTGVAGSTGLNFASGNLSLSGSGDQLFAYQGTFATPTFISGIHMNVYNTGNGDVSTTTAAAWDGDIALAGQQSVNSGKPAALTTGTNAIWIGTQGDINTERDNARFTCGPDISTAALARTALNNPANWAKSDVTAGFTLPTGCNYAGILSAPNITGNPSNTSTCEGGNASFSITATGATSYQWEVNTGGPFSPLSNNAIYSNVTTATLNITAAPVSLNGNQYHCIASNGSGPATSTAATLTVTALPVNPTLSAKTPATGSVGDGTNVSATFNAGSGGSGGGCADDFRYTTNGGASYLPYTAGTNISTAGVAAATGFVFIEGRRANCGSGCQSNYVVLASWYVTPLPAGATTLNAGDIAFTGYTSTTAADDFSFVLLKNIGAGTVINFTDNGWLSTNVLQTGEETIAWTSNAAYPAGTEIKISGLTATLANGGAAGAVTGTVFNLSSSGDQILAYRGTAASPTFISAIHMNVYNAGSGDPVTTTAAAWDGTANTQSSSALPTGLTTGVNAIWIGTQGVSASEFSNSHYANCSAPATLGDISILRAALNNQANWVSDNSTPPAFVLPTGCAYLGVGNPPTIGTSPSNSTVCEGVSTSFTVAAPGATIYQWEVNPGTGFVSVADNTIYSGATTATLTINATPLSLNGYLYRAIASNGAGSITSSPGTLTVNALPTGPTLQAKTPAANSVAEGTSVSATFTGGSAGTGCSDDFRYTTDGGISYLPYNPGANISTTSLAAGSGFVFIEGRRANCTAGCQGAYTVLAFWKVTPLPVAATTLNAGDIAFSGYASSSTDEFSFVLLRNIGPGTTINFTDNGWLSTNVLQTGEETVTWTAPAGGLSGGTEIKISGLTATKSGSGSAGTVTGTPLSLSTSGDQILAYRGTAASPTFITAIHMNVYSVANGDPTTTTAAAWDGTANTASSSALPTGLTTGVNAIWIGTQGVISSEFQNSHYANCSGPGLFGPLTTLRSALNNQANWVSDNNNPPNFTLPTGCNYLSALCPLITVTNPVNTAGTAGTPFSETFTSSGGTPTVSYTTSSALPTGITLSSGGILSGTTTQKGNFSIVVTATDGGGCTGIGAAYNLVIGCQTITVTNPATSTGTAGTSFSQLFTQTGILSGGAFTLNSGTLPTGLTLSPTGALTGTPTQSGSFPVTVKVTDNNTCTGVGPTYTLVIGCQTITVTNPVTNTGTANAAFSQTFTQSGGVPTLTYTLNSGVLPAGLNLSPAGLLSGTPTRTGSFPITVKVTDGYGCSGIGGTYTLEIGCQTITVTNPGTSTGIAGTPFNQTFSQSGAIVSAIGPLSEAFHPGETGPVQTNAIDLTYTINSGTLPNGLNLSPTGTLAGTPTQTGSFPITVKVTDHNGCTGIGVIYDLQINCQTIAVTNPGTSTGTEGSSFSQTFSQTGAIGGATFSINTGTLPNGVNLSPAGLLSGTPTQHGSFPITVKVTDGNGCTGIGGSYDLQINCPTMNVTNPGVSTGTTGSVFSQTFTQTGAVGGATFTLNSGTLPNGINLATTGLLSGTPTQFGSFPVTVLVTAGNGCTAVGSNYPLQINCQTINVTNPGTATGTTGGPFSQTFTQTGALGGATFTLNTGSLPAGLTLSPAGLLSGTPSQAGSFPITVKVTDGNGCTGIGLSYNLNIACIASPLTVTSNADDGPGSLRQAVLYACSGSTILFSGTISAITLTTGEININKALTIIGSGAENLSISGNNNSRVFLITGNVAVTIENLTITGGNGASTAVGNGFGGAIYNGGNSSTNNTLTLIFCVVTGNTALTRGGGIYNGGTAANNNVLSLVGSTVSNNSVTGASPIGGAIYNGDGTTNIFNSTISANTANGGSGGGIYSTGPATLNMTNVTISNNSATSGGGVYNNSSSVNPKNCIIAGNSAPTGPDYNGIVSSLGNNLVGKTDGGITWAASDLKGTIAAPLDPLLGALANNGGSSPTHALLPGSQAINAGNNSGAPGLDQRGITRPKQAIVDIGAFESQGFTLTVSGGNNQTTLINTASSNPLSVTVTSAFSEPVDGGKVTFTPPSSGASAAIAGNPATIASGIATTGTVIANGTQGSYLVTAAAIGVAINANFNLTNNIAAPTTTSVTSSPNPSCSGTPVNFTATITGGSAVTTGTVNFTEGVTTLASNVAVNGSGQAVFNTSSLAAGGHTITATYNGTANFATSSSTTSQSVTALPGLIINTPAVVQPTCAMPTGTITVSASGGGGNQLEYSVDNGVTWQFNPTFNSLAFSSLQPGNYFIRARIQGGSCSVAYSNNPVVLNLPTCPGKTIPGRIEAESYDAKNGPQYGIPTDDPQGGVQHVIGITNGSWMDYNVLVTQAGMYTVNFRVATTQNNPQFQIKLGGTVLGIVNITNTGGWSNWVNISVNNIALTAGSKTIRIQSTSNETCNFNWTDWSVAGANTAPTANAGPNQSIVQPASQVTLAGSGIANNGGSISSHVWTKFTGGSATINDPNSYTTTVSGLSAGTYVFRLTVTQDDNQTATSDVTIVVNPASGKFIPGRVEAESFDAKSGPQYAIPTNDAGGGQHVIGLSNGSWLDYNVNVTQTGAYTVNFRVATTQNNSQFKIISGSTLLATVNIPNTGGWDTWMTVPVTNVPLTTGTQTIRIQLGSNESSNFNWMDWSLTGPNTAPTVNAGPNQVITLPVNQVTLAGSGSANNSGGFILSHTWSKQSGGAATITDPNNYGTTVTGLAEGIYVFRLTVNQNDGQTATSDVTITVNPATGGGGGPAGKVIPGKIEAESYDSKQGGMYPVSTGDAGGGQQVIGISNGSWMDYNVTVNQAGNYTVKFRVATTQNNAQFQVRLNGNILGTINIPNTGGWDNWQTVTLNNIQLPNIGAQTIRIQSSSNESCNFNWMDWSIAAPLVATIKPDNKATDAPVVQNSPEENPATNFHVSVFPNPAHDYFNLKVQSSKGELVTIKIIDIAGRQVQQLEVVAGQTIRFGDKITNGTYFVEISQGSERIVTKVVKQ